VSSDKTVTVVPARVMPTWIRWRATWMPSRAETCRCTAVGPRRAAHPVTSLGEQVALPRDELLDGLRGSAGDFLDGGGHAVIPILAM
jgi:hypothetical protein